MDSALLRIAMRAPLCALASWLAYRGLGAVGLVTTAPLWGVALARPLIDLVEGSAIGLRRLALHDVEGKFYVFKGCPVHVHESGDGRWLRVVHVRRIVPGLPADAVLRHLCPEACIVLGQNTLYLDATALLQLLERAQAARTLRFRLWLEREVVYPLHKRISRRGVAPNGVGASDHRHADSSTGPGP